MAECFQGFTESTFRFLFELGINNNKDWFAAHKSDYESAVRVPMRALAIELGSKVKTIDPRIDIPVNPDKSISRIYRDVRFSKDKSPYRNNLWLSFERKSENWEISPGFYFEFYPEKYTFGFGYYAFPPELREKMKVLMAKDPKKFVQLYRKIKDSGVFQIGGEKYKRVLDVSLTDDQHDWCERKSLFLFSENKLDDAMFSNALVDKIFGAFKDYQEVYEYLWQIREL